MLKCWWIHMNLKRIGTIVPWTIRDVQTNASSYSDILVRPTWGIISQHWRDNAQVPTTRISMMFLHYGRSNFPWYMDQHFFKCIRQHHIGTPSTVILPNIKTIWIILYSRPSIRQDHIVYCERLLTGKKISPFVVVG